MKKRFLLLAGLLLLPALAFAKTEAPKSETAKPDALIEVRLDARGNAAETKIVHLASYVSKTRAERAIRRLAFTGLRPNSTVMVSLSADQIDSLVPPPGKIEYFNDSPRHFSFDPERDMRSVPRT